MANDISFEENVTILLERICTCKDGFTYLRGRLQYFASEMGKPILWRTAFQAAVSGVSISWHTSSVGVPGYSWYCSPGSRVLCAATVL